MYVYKYNPKIVIIDGILNAMLVRSLFLIY